MNLGLFEDAGYRQLLPLAWLRATFELRCGIDALLDKAQRHMGQPVARLWVRAALRDVVGERVALAKPQPHEDWCLLNGRALLTTDLRPPPVGVAWERKGVLVAAGVAADVVDGLPPELFLDEEGLRVWMRARDFRIEHGPESLRLIDYPLTLILANTEELLRQCQAGGVHAGRTHPGAHLLNPRAIHVARGAVIQPGAVLDAESGPIHIEADAVIGANAVVEGPCFVGPGSLVRPTTLLRGGTSIGPVCKVGGEIEASIFHGHANKQHDGFVGHSYIGPWVNLGAGTVTSDLKNTYGAIRVFLNGVGVESGQQFLGSIIADHAKTGIGTILPTGCVIGVASNVFTQAAVPRFVPSFAWLTEAGLTNYRFEKAIVIARTVMARRDVHLGEADVRLLEQTLALARQVEVAGWQ
jgi:UDP-N-acetylglucosamine diphosphorylase/glucosamine-1-phosphate N-acetyltransferase